MPPSNVEPEDPLDELPPELVADADDGSPVEPERVDALDKLETTTDPVVVEALLLDNTPPNDPADDDPSVTVSVDESPAELAPILLEVPVVRPTPDEPRLDPAVIEPITADCEA
jgi:hypothetical protein